MLPNTRQMPTALCLLWRVHSNLPVFIEEGRAQANKSSLQADRQGVDPFMIFSVQTGADSFSAHTWPGRLVQ